MNITIIPEDGMISIDGNAILEISPEYLSWIPNDVHAFHWYGDYSQGEIEFKYHPLTTKKPNERVSELGIFSQAIQTYNDELSRRQQKEIELQQISESQRDYWAELRDLRNYRLILCDWTQLLDTQLTEEEVSNWAIYRQQLRDLPQNIQDPKPLVDDPNHQSWPISP